MVQRSHVGWHLVIFVPGIVCRVEQQRPHPEPDHPPDEQEDEVLFESRTRSLAGRLVEARHDDERILVGFVAVLVERAFGTQASGANDTRQRAL
jgi:hypothetical protein